MKRSVLASLAATARAMTASQKSSQLPVLRGIVFDMDGTLTIPNLDFGEMYRRCNVDSSKDILEEVGMMPASKKAQANAIIDEMEEEGRQTLELMPGAQEMFSWLVSHKIPMALVTRNTRKTAVVLTDRLLQHHANVFDVIISRDCGLDDHPFPPKPDPAALNAIAKKWGVSLPSDGDCLLMVGDSMSNDIVFGKNAGVRTALLDTGRRYQEELAGKPAKTNANVPDIVLQDLWSLPRHLWKQFYVESSLGTFTDNFLKSPIPQPTSSFTQAAATGDLIVLNGILEKSKSKSSSPEVEFDVNIQDECGNTALIWAAENNQVAIVECLLQDPGINLNLTGYLGATAVNRASRRGHVQVLQLLIQAGADLDIPNEKLQHPLHFAAFKKNEDAVQVLLEGGANPRVLDRKGRTPAQDTSSESIRDQILDATIKFDL